MSIQTGFRILFGENPSGERKTLKSQRLGQQDTGKAYTYPKLFPALNAKAEAPSHS